MTSLEIYCGKEENPRCWTADNDLVTVRFDLDRPGLQSSAVPRMVVSTSLSHVVTGSRRGGNCAGSRENDNSRRGVPSQESLRWKVRGHARNHPVSVLNLHLMGGWGSLRRPAWRGAGGREGCSLVHARGAMWNPTGISSSSFSSLTCPPVHFLLKSQAWTIAKSSSHCSKAHVFLRIVTCDRKLLLMEIDLSLVCVWVNVVTSEGE